MSPGCMPWPVLHRVAGSPSIALLAGSPESLAADTVHPLRGSVTSIVGGVSDAPVGSV